MPNKKKTVKQNHKITPKQKKWADEYIKTGNKTEASRRTYNVSSDESAGVIWVQNLGKLNIIEYLKANSNMAASYMTSVIENPNDSTRDRITAAKDVLDRSWYKPIDKTQDVSVNIQVENMSAEELLRLIKK